MESIETETRPEEEITLIAILWEPSMAEMQMMVTQIELYNKYVGYNAFYGGEAIVNLLPSYATTEQLGGTYKEYLDYYFENLNDGRPYFFAGHSQGSRLCYMVLSEYMKEHPEYYENMIAAYCIGDSLTKKYLEENPHIKAAQSADDLGVVVSWNTEGPANKGKDSLVISPGAISINPLNWCVDETPADAELNLGTFLPHPADDGMDELPIKADAVIDLERGSVMVMNSEFEQYAISKLLGLEAIEHVFGPASYHGCDYSFFYLNIRENARTRSEAWFEKKRD